MYGQLLGCMYARAASKKSEKSIKNCKHVMQELLNWFLCVLDVLIK